MHIESRHGASPCGMSVNEMQFFNCFINLFISNYYLCTAVVKSENYNARVINEKIKLLMQEV